jgi:hypothetical protein
MADIIDLNALLRLMAESERDDLRVQMHHILMEALGKMKDLGASGADMTSFLRHTVELMEKGRSGNAE